MKNTVTYQQYREKIYRHILRLVRQPEEAEDLTQETFLRAYFHSDALLNQDAMATWLYRIAVNLCYDHFRKSAHKHTIPRITKVFEKNSPEESSTGEVDEKALRLDQLLEQAEMSACIQEFIKDLPEDYRLVILLHDLWGLSGPEITPILGCSLETIKIRLHRARRKLKAELSGGCHFSYDERGVFVCDRKSGPALQQIQPEPF